MEHGQKSIRDLFNTRTIFNIPEYQRAYAWEEQQLKDFVEDIENQRLDRDYFFGTILFEEQPSDQGFEIIDIVDGQQRITTIIIFMKLLLTKWKKAGNNVEMLEDTYIQSYNRYRLNVLEPDNEFFRSYILKDGQPSNSQVHTPSQRRLREAKKHLNELLKKYSDKVEEFIAKIENMKVLTYSVEDGSEAALIFETTNDRGKPLTNLEKAKSLLMHKTRIVSEDFKDIVKDIQSRFGEIYRNYEEIKDSGKIRDERDKTAEDLILQYHFIAFGDWKGKEYQYPVQRIKEQINGLITKNEEADATVFIEKYSLKLKESFEIMKTLLLSSDSYLLDLHALNRPAAFYPLLIKVYDLDHSDEKLNFKRVTRLAEIIGFRFGITKSRSDKGVSQLYRLAREFKGNFKQLIRKLQEFVDSYCGDSEFERSLREPKFYEVVDASNRQYLFWKYENHLRATERPISSEMSHDEFANDDSRTKFTIEHIIPQNPKESKVVVDDSILSITDFEENYLHSIGNLVLDSRSANASKSNQDFATKDKQYSKTPLKSQLELSGFSNPQPDRWNHISISDRGNKIVKFALERWNHREPGLKPAEIDKKIRLDEEMEKIWKEL